jgi:chaperonin cofactor prefoldin
MSSSTSSSSKLSNNRFAQYCASIDLHHEIEKLIQEILECKQTIETTKYKQQQEQECLNYLKNNNDIQQKHQWTFTTTGLFIQQNSNTLVDQLDNQLEENERLVSVNTTRMEKLQKQLKRIDPNDQFQLQAQLLK